MEQTGDQSSTPLSRPELNPLLNPLLAENMSRWAEVYFNNPPEKREQAVLDLLRELEVQHSEHEAATIAPRATLHNAPPTDVSAASHKSPSLPAPETALLRCERCGRDNPLTHKFCGICGETLHPKRGIDSQRAAPAYVDEDRQQGDSTEVERASERAYDRYEERLEESSSNFNGTSLVQSRSRETYDEYDARATDESERSQSYRIYLRGLLAIVLLVLGYTAWRASHSQASDGPASTTPIGVSNTQPVVTLSDSTASKKATPTPAGSRMPSPKANNGAPNPPFAGGGSEELDQAERCLNGTNGGGRDPEAAAQWLWKSIAKHNAPATLLLADLYLKGDGVSKNCDQARVLLDLAARKGVPGAGERLRNLQAFGCQ